MKTAEEHGRYEAGRRREREERGAPTSGQRRVGNDVLGPAVILLVALIAVGIVGWFVWDLATTPGKHVPTLTEVCLIVIAIGVWAGWALLREINGTVKEIGRTISKPEGRP
jgi:hypothetical protein